MIASVFLGIVGHLSFAQIVQQFFGSLLAEKTIAVLLTLYLMSLYEVFLRRSGALTRLTQNFIKLLGDYRLTSAVMPAVMGLLPSPGGARFSAPLVAETLAHSNVPDQEKAFINFWFRHIWEPILPVYPGTLMAAMLIGISPGSMAQLNWYIPIIMIVIGWLLVFGFSMPSIRFQKPNWIEILLDLGPLLAVIVAGVLIKSDFTVPTAILLACLFIYLRQYKHLPSMISLTKEALKWKMLAVIPAVYFFAAVLTATGGDKAVASSLAAMHLPNIIFFIVLPFAISLITGLTQAGVGTALPLLMGLTTPSNRVAMLNLAFVFAFAGVMASPTHLCLILSRDYFQAKAGALYNKLIMAVTVVSIFPIIFILF
ncbi:DUF401 family protein [Coprothermobacter platensis]|uniref:DUF401 family protein n=1 Tax=Coprothermobacter platensis TaxID=108819 RepID=UPI0003A3CC3A|nr:DUF401 family protein [Coprothermobacter platensis]